VRGNDHGIATKFCSKYKVLEMNIPNLISFFEQKAKSRKQKALDFLLSAFRFLMAQNACYIVVFTPMKYC
jgi:hypothetical protein